MAIAAALEDDGYHVDELIPHLANLRAGVKFDLPLACGSEKLGSICRNTYGFINHQGYLESGLPLDYGEGAAELLDTLLHPEKTESREMHHDIAEGDISRAYVEWLSLLRHITHAPAHPWKRWTDLQEETKRVLKRHDKTMRHLFYLDLPALTHKQRHSKPRHYFMAKS